MVGGFYGSLAASASVFVAILTALLVNEYVRIKGERRQLEHRQSQIESKIDGLEIQRNAHRDTVDEIREQWEEEYRDAAKERVEEFIESHVGTAFAKPVEKLTLEELYHELAEYHDFDSPDDMEGDAMEPHHKDVLSDKLATIKMKVASEFTEDFAEEHRGEGWEGDEDGKSLKEVFEDSEQEFETIEDDEMGFSSSFIDFEAELPEEPLELEDFIKKYKEEYDLDKIENITEVSLKTHYENIVDTPLDIADSNLLPNLPADDFLFGSDPGIAPPTSDAVITASKIESVSERRRFDEAQNKVVQLNSQISALENEMESIENELQSLEPSDLKEPLLANVLTILFSVVLPMVFYMFAVMELSLFNNDWLHTLEVIGVFTFWIVGLVIVFEWIYAEIRNQEPKLQPVYDRIARRI